ncbi:hypothetical protein [Micromonospora zhanjiangensis]|uniref:Uncharacterized protein n=1 Tax=Micromonospora zhanjiangensis TaxID=1522057 RepID=A0ABV8KU39_9ACTN
MTNAQPGRWVPAAGLTLLLLLTATGCAADRPGPAAGGGSSTVAPTSAPATTPVTPDAPATPTAAPTSRPAGNPKPAPVAVPVVVTRSGGFAGTRDTVTVDPDGRWTRTDRTAEQRRGRLTDGQQTRLRALLADPALAGESGPAPNPRCADAYAYTVTAGRHQVSYQDCPAGAAPKVGAAIAALLLDATG